MVSQKDQIVSFVWKAAKNAACLYFLVPTQTHFGISFLAVSEGIPPTTLSHELLKSNTADAVNHDDLFYYSW